MRVLTFEDVAEHGAQPVGSLMIGIERNLFGAPQAQRAYVVESQDVVRVRVRVENRVQAAHALAYRLRAKVGSGVDQNAVSAVLNEHRGTRALVTRITRCTHPAIASNGGYTHRGAAAEYGKQRFHLFFWSSRRDRARLRGTRDGVGQLEIGHAQFEQRALQHVLLARSQVSLGFLAQDAERIYRLARAHDVGAWLLAFGRHQAQLQHRRHVKRGHQALESHLVVLHGLAAFFTEQLVELFVRLLVGIVLRALFGVGRRLRSTGLLRWRCVSRRLRSLCGNVFACRRLGAWGSLGRLFLSHGVGTQIAFYGELAPVGDDKIGFFFLSHSFHSNGRFATRALAPFITTSEPGATSRRI